MNRILEEEERERERESDASTTKADRMGKKKSIETWNAKKLYGRHFGLRRVFCFTPSLIGWFHRVGE